MRISQDPSSLNLGTTVWDAAIVLAKFLEKVRGQLCRGTILACSMHADC